MRLTTNLKTFLVSLLLISFTTAALAAEPKGVVAKLNEGDRVPFQAWCFNLPAAAKIIAYKEGETARCQLKISKALEKQKADFDFRLGSMAAELQYHRDVSNKTIEALQVENQELERIALDKPNNYWYLFAGGGIVVGILTAVLVVHAVN